MTYRTPTGEARWANTDPSLHCNGVERDLIDWRRVHNYCLKMYDYEAAELIFDKNKKSDECEEGDHDLCNFSWCRCEHHSAIQFKTELAPLLSCREVESREIEELEVA